MNSPISFAELRSALGSPQPPLIIDVRRAPAFNASTEVLGGALRREPEAAGVWAKALPRASAAVVYCVHGHEVSQGVARTLSEAGIKTRYLEGGIEEGWKAQSGALDRKPKDAGTRWVTR